jgi:hypothetical protein
MQDMVPYRPPCPAALVIGHCRTSADKAPPQTGLFAVVRALTWGVWCR